MKNIFSDSRMSLNGFPEPKEKGTKTLTKRNRLIPPHSEYKVSNNMFKNYNDSIRKRPPIGNNNYSFDVNMRKNFEENDEINYDKILQDILSIYHCNSHSLLSKIKNTKGVNDLYGANCERINKGYLPRGCSVNKFVKIKKLKDDCYKKQIVLYKNLCEKLIAKSETGVLERLNCFLTDEVKKNQQNETFLNHIKRMISKSNKRQNSKNKNTFQFSTKW